MADLDKKPASGAKNPLSWTITPVDPKGGMVGAGLRVAREERGLSVDDVAAVLKIRREHIASIESSRIDDLPGLPYAIGFVRTYAEYLGMDGLDAVRRFKEEFSEPQGDGALSFPTPISDRKFPTALLFAGPVVLAAVLYGAWYYFLGGDPTAGDPTATVATAESSPKEGQVIDAAEPAATATPATPAPTATIPVEQSAEESGAAPERLTETEASPASPAEPAAEPADVEAPPAAPPAPRPPIEPATPADNSSAAEAAAEEARPALPADAEASAETEASATESGAPATTSAPPSPPAVEEAEAAPASPAVPAAGEQAAPPEAAPAKEIEAESETGSAAEESAAPSAAPSATAPSAGPSVGQVATAPSRIELRATADSWVVVRNAQSKVLFARILGAGESYEVPSLPNLSMVTGNAGALDIYVDGKIIKPLGPMGAIRRDVVLDPDHLLAAQ